MPETPSLFTWFLHLGVTPNDHECSQQEETKNVTKQLEGQDSSPVHNDDNSEHVFSHDSTFMLNMTEMDEMSQQVNATVEETMLGTFS